MTTTRDTLPPLTVGARRRVLVEFADTYNAEQVAAGRPITAALPALLPVVCAAHLTPSACVDLFVEFARERRVLGQADATYDAMEAAEQRAEGLLDALVGEAL